LASAKRLLQRIEANIGCLPQTMITDAGYCSEENIKSCEQRGIDPHIATGRLSHGQPPPPLRGPISNHLDAIGRMVRKLRCKKGKRSTPGKDHRRARFWPEQGGQGTTQVPAAGPGESEWRMEPDDAPPRQPR